MTQVNGKQTQVENVRRIFNQMADEYDHLGDLWYRYTFAGIDDILSNHFRQARQTNPKLVAVDIGCGTGLQSLRLASMGYKVVGIDIAEELLKIARIKLSTAGYHDAEFYIADAQSLPLCDSIADCVNCCGPTLSFVPDWRTALSEAARCLKPGGNCLLEVDGKWNFDLIWEIINALGFNFLKYNQPVPTSLRHLLPPWHVGHVIAYSFKLESGQSVSMPLRLFTARELRRELQNVGLVQKKQWSLHVLTNLIPSTVLHKSDPGGVLKLIFVALSSLEKRLNSFSPLNAFGCSLLVLAQKQGSQACF
jgi:ubiquinone/menaquinone biosynthesis C-methylase UbiE